MTQSIMVEPEEVLAPGSIHFSDIPVNAYRRTFGEESARYSTEEFLNIWQDMCAIREFETVLNEIKIKGRYKGLAYQHAGPAHLSIGQEAAAVGMAFALTPEDHIFGSHRSHGEILAKGFSAIWQLEERPALLRPREHPGRYGCGPLPRRDGARCVLFVAGGRLHRARQDHQRRRRDV
jgi:2-oxoisovalerate dehydrogenase E1 component